MRPKSVVMFERLFLASLALSVVNFFVSYDAAMEELARQPGVTKLGIGDGLLIATMTIGTAIYLLLWFLIARKASNVAKWVLVVFVAIGAVSFLAALTSARFDAAMMLALVLYALEIAAVAFLFKEDAKAWLKGEWDADPAAFD